MISGRICENYIWYINGFERASLIAQYFEKYGKIRQLEWVRNETCQTNAPASQFLRNTPGKT